MIAISLSKGATVHYYSHNIKEFRAGCHNLESRLDRWIYRDMIEAYYDREGPFPDDIAKICEILGLRRENEREIVSGLLLLKFHLTESGWAHDRCDEEIARYHANAEIARANGKKGGRPSRQKEPIGFPSGSSPVPDGGQAETGLKANQEPENKNHKPEKKKAGSRGTRIPDDWHPDAEDTAFCKQKRPDLRPSEVAQAFYDHWISVPGQKGLKLNWSATWRNWVRNQRAPSAGGGGGGSAWFASETGIIAKGAEFGLTPNPGEPMPSFRARVQATIDNGGKPPPPPRQSRVGIAQEGPAPARSQVAAETLGKAREILGKKLVTAPQGDSDECST